MTRIVTSGFTLLAVVLTACVGGGETDDVPGLTASQQSAAETVMTAAATPSVTAEPSPTVQPSATPVGEAELAVGFAVPFTLTAPADWGFGEAITATALDIVDGTGFRTVLAAFLKSPDAPDVWVERLTTHEGIDASEPQPVEVGGAPGHVFNVRLNDSAPACAGGGSGVGGTCFPIHGPEDGWLWVIEDGRPAQIWVLDVAGETVMLSSDAREDRFEAWAAKIEEVVSTLEWAQP